MQLTTIQKQFCILGDLNTDISECTPTNNKLGKELNLNLTASHHRAEMLIDKSTRVTLTTATVLDHILTNITQYSITLGVLRYDLTDHLLL